MTTLAAFSLLLLLAYVFIIGRITLGWMRLPAFNNIAVVNAARVSIVVAMRNEAANVNGLLDCLLKQNIDPKLLEIIIVNDRSQDETLQLLQQIASNYMGNIHLKIIDLEDKNGSGKKASIHAGIQASTGELILITDADCRMQPAWARIMVSFYERYKPHMILGPVVMANNGSLFGRLQSLEFSSLIASAAGACSNQQPIMANGANIAFTRHAYDTCGGFAGNMQFASGDDVFLMQSIKQKIGAETIRFIRSREAIVNTPAETTWKSFWNQRKRWVSKSRGYTDKILIFTSIIIFLANVGLLMLGITALLSPIMAELFTTFFIIKLFTDIPLLLSFNRFTANKRILWLVLPMEILNAVYTTAIGIVGNLGNYKWKGREI